MKNKGKKFTVIAFGVFCLLFFVGRTPHLSLFSLLAWGLLAYAVYKVILHFLNNRKKHTDDLPFLSKEKEEYYLEHGMTKSEIDLFRNTMNQAKKQIEQLQNNTTQNAKLKAIDLRYDTLRVAKALFKELVKDPTKLPEASQFLYTHLPNLVDLTDNYVTISNHEIKTKETYAKLDEGSQIIAQVSQLIAQDYHQFVADDLDDLDVEVSIAKQSINRDNKNSL